MLSGEGVVRVPPAYRGGSTFNMLPAKELRHELVPVLEQGKLDTVYPRRRTDGRGGSTSVWRDEEVKGKSIDVGND